MGWPYLYMKPFEWIPGLNLGIEMIDSEHRHLFELYNRAVFANDERFERDELFQDLMDYAHKHFTDEEQLMESAGYPDLEPHKSLHRSFVRRVESLRSSPDWQVLDFFHEWLFRHIMAEDTKIKRFLDSRK